MAPFFGNSVACRIAEAHEIKHSTLVLGDWRAAQRIEFFIGRNGQPAEAGPQAQGEEVVEAAGAPPLVLSTRGGSASSSTSSELGAEAAAATAGTRGARSVVSGLGGGFKVWVVNTHLDHEHPDNRQRQVGSAGAVVACGLGAGACQRSYAPRCPGLQPAQALSVCEWMDREKADCAAIILCGDFNGPPHEPFHALLRRLGYVSAYKARHGQEPQASLALQSCCRCR